MNDNAKSDPKPGTKMPKKCPNCYREVEKGERICVGCGTDILTGKPTALSKRKGKSLTLDKHTSVIGLVVSLVFKPIKTIERLASHAYPENILIRMMLFFLVSLAFIIPVQAVDFDSAGRIFFNWDPVRIFGYIPFVIFELVLATAIISLMTFFYGELGTVYEVFPLVTLFLGIINIVRIILVPLALIPAAGQTLATIVLYLTNLWMLFFFGILTWRLYRCNLGVSILVAVFLGVMYLGVNFLVFQLIPAVRNTFLIYVRMIYTAAGVDLTTYQPIPLEQLDVPAVE